MSFNPRNKERTRGSSITPLLQDTPIDQLISQVEKNYLDLCKYVNELKDYSKHLPTFSHKDFMKNREEIQYKIQTLPSIISAINEDCDKISHCEVLRQHDYDPLQKEKLQKMSEYLNPKMAEVPVLLSEIYEKEKDLTKKFQSISNDQLPLYEDLHTEASQGQKEQSESKERDTQLIMRDIMDDKQYLERRRVELEQIKSMTTQLKDIAVYMGQEVNKQGHQLSQMEDDVAITKDNAIKAEKEIVEASKGSQSTVKRILLVSGIILFVVICIVLILVFVFIGNKS